jgi:hypothetical protein
MIQLGRPDSCRERLRNSIAFHREPANSAAAEVRGVLVSRAL